MRIGVLPWNSVDIQAVLQNMDMIEEGTLTTVGAYKEDQNRIAKSMHIDVCGTQNLNIDNVDALIVYLERKYQRLEPWNKIIQQSYLAGKTIFVPAQLLGDMNAIGVQAKILEKTLIGWKKRVEYMKLREIQIPVVGITGSGVNCDKFTTQLAMKRYLDQQGYKAVYLCSNALGSLFGMYTIPQFVWDKTLTLEEKILYLNEYIWSLWHKEMPDVIVVGIPGGTLPLPKDEYNHFGEAAYIICNALDIDVNIHHVYYCADFSNEADLSELSKHLFYRYGLTMDLVVVSTYYAEKSEMLNEYEYFNADALGLYDETVNYSHVGFRPIVYAGASRLQLEKNFMGLLDLLQTGVRTL